MLTKNNIEITADTLPQLIADADECLEKNKMFDKGKLKEPLDTEEAYNQLETMLKVVDYLL